MRQATFLAVMFLMLPLSGCFSPTSTTDADSDDTYYPDIYDRYTLEWNWDGSYAMVLEPGPFEALEVQEATITVDTNGVWGGGPNRADVQWSDW